MKIWFSSCTQDERLNRSSKNASSSLNQTKSTSVGSEDATKETQKSTMGARATDSARLMKFKKELSGTAVILGISQNRFSILVHLPVPYTGT